jgi:hypothetical protein
MLCVRKLSPQIHLIALYVSVALDIEPLLLLCVKVVTRWFALPLRL